MSDSSERDPLEEVEKAFDDFADATEQSLLSMRAEMKTFMDQVRTEQRSAPVPASQSIDIDALATRAAALVPTPTIDDAEIVRRVVAQIPIPKDGENGKDAVVNQEEIIARVAEIAIPRITSAIPVPTVDTDALIPKIAAMVPRPKDGEDGLSAPEEIRGFIAQAFAEHFKTFYQGVWRPDAEYRTGQAVTCGGSFWLAQRETKAQPETADSGWVLIAKRGRDGRDRTGRA